MVANFRVVFEFENNAEPVVLPSKGLDDETGDADEQFLSPRRVSAFFALYWACARFRAGGRLRMGFRSGFERGEVFLPPDDRIHAPMIRRRGL